MLAFHPTTADIECWSGLTAAKKKDGVPVSMPSHRQQDIPYLDLKYRPYLSGPEGLNSPIRSSLGYQVIKKSRPLGLRHLKLTLELLLRISGIRESNGGMLGIDFL